jgi:mannose-1-phosphate guanylyltransferase
MKDEELNLVAIIIAGGAGKRFWPLSTEEKPKQFLNLFGDRSLLQKSYDRISGIVKPERILILTHIDFVKLVKEQLPHLPDENIIGEPFRRDTAAAITLAALLCKKRFKGSVMAILTADHIIEPVQSFLKTLISAAKKAAKENVLYTLGIKPAYPATGYGYLELGDTIHIDNEIKHYKLLRFKEKPSLNEAKKYLESGNFYWNSGMFIFSAETIIQEIKIHLPEHFEILSLAMEKEGTSKWQKSLYNAFSSITPISIDYGVMEKAKDIRTVISNFYWIDVGGWLALGDFLKTDEKGNASKGHISVYNADNNIVFSEDKEEMIALVGVKDLVIVRAGKKTLVVRKDKTEDIKKLVARMEDK